MCVSLAFRCGFEPTNATNPKLKEGKGRNIYLKYGARILEFSGFGKVFVEMAIFHKTDKISSYPIHNKKTGKYRLFKSYY